MAEYAPLHKGAEYTRRLSGTVTGGQVVIVSGSGTVAAGSAATHLWFGVAAVDGVSGDDIGIETGGVQKLIASGAITAGQLVEVATAGKVAAHTNGTNDFNVLGLALTTAVDGAVVEVKPTR